MFFSWTFCYDVDTVFHINRIVAKRSVFHCFVKTQTELHDMDATEYATFRHDTVKSVCQRVVSLMDRLHYGQNFEKSLNRKIYYHSIEEHPKISKIAKFGCNFETSLFQAKIIVLLLHSKCCFPLSRTGFNFFRQFPAPASHKKGRNPCMASACTDNL